MARVPTERRNHPHAYAVARAAIAKRLLIRGMPVAEIAHALGMSQVHVINIRQRREHRDVEPAPDDFDAPVSSPPGNVRNASGMVDTVDTVDTDHERNARTRQTL